MVEGDLPPVLALVSDLMFVSKIMAEARAGGILIQVVRDPAKMAQCASAQNRLLLADLNLPGAIEAAAAWRQGGERQVVGFVSHVDTEAIARAKAAGIDRVLPRSRFVALLPGMLRESSNPQL